MDRNNPIHVDIEPPNIGFEIEPLWIGDLGRLGSRRERGCMDIGFDQTVFPYVDRP
jgi:hypothetical protein